MNATELRPRIVTVCTGNLCRSPLAAALLARELSESGIEADVASAGTAAPVDASPDRNMLELADDFDIALAEHRSRLLADAAIAGADLVLTMTSQHTAAVVRMFPSLAGRTVTLRAAAFRARLMAGEQLPFAEWVRRLAAEAPYYERSEYDPSNDIADPIGKRMREYRAVGTEIAALVHTLVAHWCGR